MKPSLLWKRRKSNRKAKRTRRRAIAKRLKGKARWKLGEGHAKGRAKIGTWNTRGLGASGGRGIMDPAEKLKGFVKIWEARKWCAVLLTDVCFGGTGIREYKSEQETWTIIHHGKVAVALCREMTRHWRRGGAVWHGGTGGFGARCMKVEIPPKSGAKGVRLIPVYFHTSDRKHTEARAELYENLENLAMTTNRQRRGFSTLIGGDFNAETGPDKDQVWGGTQGKWGDKRRTQTGTRLLEFAWACKMRVAGTYFQKAAKSTWTHPRYKTGHTLDHFLVPANDWKRIRQVAVLTPENAVGMGATSWAEMTDHNPVEITLQGAMAVVAKKNEEGQG